MTRRINTENYLNLVREMWSRFDKDGRMPKEIFERFVGNKFGTDPRTINKHRKNMGKYGIIEVMSLYVQLTPDARKVIQEEITRELTKQAQETS